MSYTSRPNLRTRKRIEAIPTTQKESRKRKSRPCITEDDYKIKKNNSSKMTLEEMELKCDELTECFHSQEKNKNNDNSDNYIDSNPEKRRRSARCQQQPTNTTDNSSLQFSNKVAKDIDTSRHCLRPHTPELINKMKSITFSNYFSPTSKDSSPLPQLSWANSDEVWEMMLKKDLDYQRDALYIQKHPSLEPRMRSVLLDWLIEVCEVYKLHRETFYLAVDYVDRYLSTQRNISKTRLQLIGVTALFVAAKIEEIYPPKLAEFSYVTDSACTDEEILLQECNMLEQLKWRLSPVTPISWLTAYLQISNRKLTGSCKENIDDSFEMPQFSGIHLCHISELIDICCLDTGYLQFSYSIIAASSLYHMWGKDITPVTGHKFEQLLPCIQWLAPYARVIHSQNIKPIKRIAKIPPEDAHNIQVHNSSVELLDYIHSQMNNQPKSSPMVQCKGILTPPRSTEKHS